MASGVSVEVVLVVAKHQFTNWRAHQRACKGAISKPVQEVGKTKSMLHWAVLSRNVAAL